MAISPYNLLSTFITLVLQLNTFFIPCNTFPTWLILSLSLFLLLQYRCEKSMIDYITVDEKLRKDVLDAKAVKGMLEGSDHYVVIAKIKIEDYLSKCFLLASSSPLPLSAPLLCMYSFNHSFHLTTGLPLLHDHSISLTYTFFTNSSFFFLSNTIMWIYLFLTYHSFW